MDRLQEAIAAHHGGIAFVTPAEFNNDDTGAVIIVYPTSSPQSAQTGTLVQTLRNDVIPPAVGGTTVNAQVGGQTAGSIDAANFLGHRLFLVIGAGFCAWSGWNYHRNRRAIDAERFEPERLSVAVLSAVVVLGGLGLVVLVLWRTLGAEE